MRDNGYTTLALGQHLDDVCESSLMSTFRNGFLRTMKANYFVEAGDLRVPGADGRVISGWFATFKVYLLMLAERCKAVGLAMRRDSLGGRRPFLRECDCLIRV